MSSPAKRSSLQKFNHSYRSMLSGGRLFGLVLIFLGLVVILTAVFVEVETNTLKIALVAGIPFLIGVILVSTYTGTLLDFENRKYKEYQTLLFFKLGEWKKLPKIEHAEMILHSFRSRNLPNGMSPTLSGEVTIYKCVLISNGTKFLALDFEKEKAAVAALKKVKEGLGLL